MTNYPTDGIFSGCFFVSTEFTTACADRGMYRICIASLLEDFPPSAKIIFSDITACFKRDKFAQCTICCMFIYSFNPFMYKENMNLSFVVFCCLKSCLVKTKTSYKKLHFFCRLRSLSLFFRWWLYIIHKLIAFQMVQTFSCTLLEVVFKYL